jgi:hypothetical protein
MKETMKKAGGTKKSGNRSSLYKMDADNKLQY